ncbi:hypothetical protein CLHUN_38350 [Ruminiclostridium hungatei]|uniref:Ternary complex associated domain-containing protein n=1 Tax=Ruminiclostridium hungatei TaxID=48256 RepID=A0A1V4SER2_RUMHU|nr:phosphotransferase [Ruminiclostridium hungatei]OPX42314.1 hypothetical protein CLHUN_38350 [Ruminiclostridium hungatei]
MKKFYVLVVDDDKEICEMALNMSNDREDVVVFTATTNEQALSLIKNNFFHVACIDLLSTDGDFKMIFKVLNERRPSCKCYLITGKAGDKPINLLLELLIPSCPRIEGAIDKCDINYTNVILDMADTYFKNAKVINSVDILYEEIKKKKTRYLNGHVAITSEEVEYLLSYIFGQRMNFTNKNSYNDIEQIITGAQLVLLSGGRSKSIVALAKAKTKEVSIEDFYTVIKISPIDDIKEEINRYKSYVKFMVGLSSRVELLDYVLGDTLGAVCYSFAGKPSNNIKNISDVFREKQDQAKIYLKKLFDVNTKEWMADSNIKQEKDILKYFKNKYKFNHDDFKKNIKTTIELCGSKNEKLHNILENVSKKVGVLLAGGKIRETYNSCIVHGDMNSNNVIIDENIDPKVILIDYSDTGRGPIAIDFAALECSLRLDVDTGDLSGDEYDFYLCQYGYEKECTELFHRAGDDLPYWTKISKLLFKLYCNNFKFATKEEYLITNVLWGARVCNVKSVRHSERLRILLWIASLLDQLII